MNKDIFNRPFALTLVGALVATAWVVQPVHAQAAAGTKIAVFDPQLIYAESNAAKRLGSQLRAKQERASAQIENLEKPIAEKQQELTTKQGLLAAEKLKTAQDDLRKDVVNYRTQAMRISQEFERDQYNARKELTEAMRVAVSAIAKEKGYEIVVPKGVALYSAPSVPDISREVLSRVNTQLK